MHLLVSMKEENGNENEKREDINENHNALKNGSCLETTQQRRIGAESYVESIQNSTYT
jgi:hypothetical protein